MNPWQFWFPPAWGASGSGNFVQPIAPQTSWFSPRYEVNFKGDPAIEAHVIEEVASYGKQLGWLIDGLLAIAGDNQSGDIEQVRKLKAEVEAVKQRHEGSLEDTAREALDRLRDADEHAYARVLDRHRPAPPPSA